jgi:oligoribonuclease NrnB/cAMP/cGMP phosphodiesterase (DHH superfamily)
MICVYHEGDFDGQCSAAIVQKMHQGAHLIPMDYEKQFPWGEITPLDPVCMDCGAIAKRYGGGGHRKAAGFITQNLPF